MSPQSLSSSDDIIVISNADGSDQVRVHRFGATIISWKSNGEEQLFLSSKACMDGSRAIRGGIPLVFPQFGPPANRQYPSLPQHGIARLMHWDVVEQRSGRAVLRCANAAGPVVPAFPARFALTYTIEVARGRLSTKIDVENCGATFFACDWLFHTYFLVSGDIDSVGVSNMRAKRIDGVDEVCEMHYNVGSEIVLRMAGGGKDIVIHREGLPDYVIWNPGKDKAAGMDDFEEGGERKMVCVEAGAIHPESPILLEPNQTRSFGQVLEIIYRA